MKNRNNRITERLFAVVALTAALVGTIFAQTSLAEKTEKTRVRATAPMRRPFGGIFEKWRIKKASESNRRGRVGGATFAENDDDAILYGALGTIETVSD